MTTLEGAAYAPPLHLGAYLPPEAARLIRAGDYPDGKYGVTGYKLHRWVREGLGAPEQPESPGRERELDFLDLVSMRVVCALRANGVPLNAVRRAERWLSENTGLPKPLATQDLWAGSGHVFTKWVEQLVKASGAGQLVFPILQEHLIRVSNLTFNEDTRLASSWSPRLHVSLDPLVQFGAACIDGTRIPTSAIAGYLAAGESVEFLSSAYGISPDAVEAARDWEARLAA